MSSVEFVDFLKEIQEKWGKKWVEDNLFKAEDFDTKRKKFYLLTEFPYPSHVGLHMGHCRSYTMMDIYTRYLRMKGYNVLFPMGWDAFGLPTYNYAIKVNRPPKEVAKENVKNFKNQLIALGGSFDWTREINTTDPEYYRWTQWIFIQLYNHWYDPEYPREDGKKGKARPISELEIPDDIKKKGPKAIKEYQDRFRLAYKAKMPVYYCPHCRIGVADEEVEPGGTHERCHQPLEKRYLEQWLLRITAYADRLIEDLELVDFPDSVKRAQINWIGRKYGAEVKFFIENTDYPVTIFTTRLDTIYGVTFVAVSPEHSFVEWYFENVNNLGIDEETQKKVREYVEEARKKVDKTFEQKIKTGVFTGVYAVSPVTGEKVPVYVADFVLDEVGTGAIMGVPAHDQRDYEFATTYKLPIKVVIVPKDVYEKGQEAIEEFSLNLTKAYEKEGVLVQSDKYTGLSSNEAKKAILEDLYKKRLAEQVKYYRLRDWVFSRQHYWGEPTPMIYCERCGWNPVPEDELPVILPDLDDYKMADDGTSPLQRATEWINTTCPECGGPARRETDVMPNWAGSNWYYVRYLDPHNKERLVDEKKAIYWLPVDFYDGGAEHTTMHLLYSRFIYKFLYDIGVVPTPEPYAKRRNHGLVLGPDGKKMSKSRGNVVNPWDVIEKFGADTVRMYVAFMGPYEGNVPWSDESARGVLRFLERAKAFIERSIKHIQENKGFKNNEMLTARLHRLIKRVSENIESLKFNTAVAALMEFLNNHENDVLDGENLEVFLKLLAPFAPFFAEEYWSRLSKPYSIHTSDWPVADEKLIEAHAEFVIPVQINGKVRGQVTVQGKVEDKEVILQIIRKDPKINRYLEGKKIQKVIFVPGKIINLVVKE